MTDKLSHERVMEIKLTVAKSALKQMLEMAQRDIEKMKAERELGIANTVRSVDAISMVTQLSNLASFTLADLKASDEQITGIAHGGAGGAADSGLGADTDEQITGIAHGGVLLDEEEHMNYPAEMEETHE